MNMKIFYENTIGRGEDAGIAGENYAIVFDGLGGTGGMRCRNAAGEVRTEAKVASNAAAQAAEAAIRESWPSWNLQMKAAKPDARRRVAVKMVRELKRAIDRQLAYEMTVWTHDASKRYMPTTMAGWVTFPQDDGKLIAVAVWAGDSRCYMMDGERMQQVSADDADVKPGEDVMTEILSQESPRMSNIICVDKPYRLNCKCIELDKAALLFACTDGMYGSLPSPMHLEYYMRLAFGEGASMQDAQEALHSFIGSALVVKDDSCTVCGLGYAPETQSFAELAGAMLAPADMLDETYVSAFPAPPEVPDGDDADSILRRVAKSLSGKPSFLSGLNAYIERMGNMPGEAVGKQPGSELINDLRGRSRYSRAEYESRLHEIDRSIAGEENRLRACTGGMKVSSVQTKEVGSRSFSRGWYETTMSEAEKVSYVFKNIDRLQSKMFSSGSGGYVTSVRYTRPSEHDVMDAAVFLHDLIVLMESITPLDAVFTGYRQTEVVEQPLSDVQRTQLITALLGDAPLTNSIVPNLCITPEQMETISACRQNIREWKQKRREAEAEDDFTVTLTEEDKAKIAEHYALLYAREMLREWYRTHVKPEGIEMSETLTASCLSQLEKCWSEVDRRREDYRLAYEAFRSSVMALWAQYQPGYAGDDCGVTDSSDTEEPWRVFVPVFQPKEPVQTEPAVEEPVPEEPGDKSAPEPLSNEPAPDPVPEQPEDLLPPGTVLEGMGVSYEALIYASVQEGKAESVADTLDRMFARVEEIIGEPEAGSRVEAKHVVRGERRGRLGGTHPKGRK